MNIQPDRAKMERFAGLVAEKRKRQAKAEMCQRGYRDEETGEWRGGLLAFIRYFWPVLEPATVFKEGWALEAICEHLEAVTFGEIHRLLVNVPPGYMKSLLTDVFWPAFEWGPMNMAHLRYVAFSYSAGITERDNDKFGILLMSPEYREMFGDRVRVRKCGQKEVSNYKHGRKLATSVEGIGTGERGDRVILDDPHKVNEGDGPRQTTVTWFREAMSNRLNDSETGAIVIIMQRVHEADVSGTILEEGLDYVHLMIPMEFDWERVTGEDGQPIQNAFGWTDPRWTDDPEECNGELAWPERFPPEVWAGIKKEVGPHAVAGQYQQTPKSRGTAIIASEYWQLWDDPTGKFPAFEFILASLDSAFTEKEQNDPSALTMWGVFRNEAGHRRIMLIHAWRKRLKLHGKKVEKKPNEHVQIYRRRAMPHWGLVEWVADSCNRFQADKLLIESKASGIDAANELMRLHGREGWGIELINPGNLDKVARALAVQATFSQEMIFAPDREWAQMVIDECDSFPRGRHDDLCFAAGTLIATKRGRIPIEFIKAGDAVLTPIGWRKVTASGVTGVRPTVERHGLVGTPNHPVFTFDSGFVPLDSATQAISRVTLCDLMKTQRQMRLNSKAFGIAEWEEGAVTTSLNPAPTMDAEKRRAYTSRFGNSILGETFRRSMRFTTRTGTRLISSLAILSAYRLACIGQCLRTIQVRANIWLKSATWLLLGMPRQKELSGIASTRQSRSINRGSNMTGIRWLASEAVLSAVPATLSETSDENFARLVANQSMPIEKRRRDVRPVYNLTVEGCSCYYANDILVHNCDSTTQAIKHLRTIGLANSDEEAVAEEREAVTHKQKPRKALYPV